MTATKRIFDLAVALALSVVLIPVMVALVFVVLIFDGRAAFYLSERMKTPTQGFSLIKFRTMKPSAENAGVSGGDKAARITRSGHFLRRSRLDELPQLFNVLKGDISFVGPRPPLRQYVERFPSLYGNVLRSRPGITGLASTRFHGHEERLLARSQDAAETDLIYMRNCIPRKAALDLIYQKNWTICFDIVIMIQTVFKKR